MVCMTADGSMGCMRPWCCGLGKAPTWRNSPASSISPQVSDREFKANDFPERNRHGVIQLIRLSAVSGNPFFRQPAAVEADQSCLATRNAEPMPKIRINHKTDDHRG